MGTLVLGNHSTSTGRWVHLYCTVHICTVPWAHLYWGKGTLVLRAGDACTRKQPQDLRGAPSPGKLHLRHPGNVAPVLSNVPHVLSNV
eukprot:3940661-Rhodomonas_salina.5